MVNHVLIGGYTSNIIIIATYLLIVYLVYRKVEAIMMSSTEEVYNKINLAPKLNIKILSHASL